jgi:hypothetical protein
MPVDALGRRDRRLAAGVEHAPNHPGVGIGIDAWSPRSSGIADAAVVLLVRLQFMRWATISPTSCERWLCRRRSSSGR